ncbi:hypothetical protein [Streptomyces sp. NPDC051561]|uniref:hypothetical protein n=1 Tax=Streptomyces sp. NPDC051561 TaxID=3365658 RepID=UPI0037A60BFA
MISDNGAWATKRHTFGDLHALAYLAWIYGDAHAHLANAEPPLRRAFAAFVALADLEGKRGTRDMQGPGRALEAFSLDDHYRHLAQAAAYRIAARLMKEPSGKWDFEPVVTDGGEEWPLQHTPYSHRHLVQASPTIHPFLRRHLTPECFERVTTYRAAHSPRC